MEQFPLLFNRTHRTLKAVKQNRDSRKQRPFAGRALMAARAILALALLLTLIAGSIALPAAASGPLCTLACCAGRAPHAAGSCMQGSCQSGASGHHTGGNTSSQAHHHHEQQTNEQSDQSSILPGAIASVGGSEMGDVPTIEATPYNASTDAETASGTSNKSDAPRMVATFLSKPCQADCGACAASFAASKRPRNAATLAGSTQTKPQPLFKLANDRQVLTYTQSAPGRQFGPRGPPLVSYCYLKAI